MTSPAQKAAAEIIALLYANKWVRFHTKTNTDEAQFASIIQQSNTEAVDAAVATAKAEINKAVMANNNAVLAVVSSEKRVKELEAALRAVMVMWKSPKPTKLDEALTWRQNDEKAEAMAIAALEAPHEP